MINRSNDTTRNNSLAGTSVSYRGGNETGVEITMNQNNSQEVVFKYAEDLEKDFDPENGIQSRATSVYEELPMHDRVFFRWDRINYFVPAKINESRKYKQWEKAV